MCLGRTPELFDVLVSKEHINSCTLFFLPFFFLVTSFAGAETS